MVRAFLSLALALPGLLAPVLVGSSVPAAATASPQLCGGWRVTIDLNRAGAPDPDRPRRDVVLGTPRRDVIRTGDGDDVVCAGGGADRVFLGGGADFGYGGPGADLLEGGGRSDHVNGGAGDDVIRGGEGWDQLETYPSAPGVDKVYGGVGNDTFRHANVGDVYVGGSGRDFFDDPAYCADCGDGVITYLGGADHDIVGSGSGNEFFDGGDGSDIVSYFDVGTMGGPGVTVDLALAGPQDTGPGGTDTLVDVEELGGSAWGPDLLYGDDGPNRIVGSWGDDQIFGRGGDDDLQGSDGADLCDGGEGTDQYQDCEEIS